MDTIAKKVENTNAQAAHDLIQEVVAAVNTRETFLTNIAAKIPGTSASGIAKIADLAMEYATVQVAHNVTLTALVYRTVKAIAKKTDGVDLQTHLPNLIDATRDAIRWDDATGKTVGFRDLTDPAARKAYGTLGVIRKRLVDACTAHGWDSVGVKLAEASNLNAFVTSAPKAEPINKPPTGGADVTPDDAGQGAKASLAADVGKLGADGASDLLEALDAHKAALLSMFDGVLSANDVTEIQALVATKVWMAHERAERAKAE